MPSSQRFGRIIGKPPGAKPHGRSRRDRLSRRLRIEPLEDRRMLDGLPLITELMANNVSTLPSQSFDDFPDWIEIYNPGPGPVDLQDWYLTDRKNELHGWQFPSSCVLAEDEYLVVFASGEDTVTEQGEWHTNFRLATDGEYLALVKPDGTSVISEYEPQYPPQTPDISYGLTAGFDDEAYFTTPTPAEMNPPSFTSSVFIPEHGFYDSPIRVLLNTGEVPEPIHYTTDGSNPTAEDSLFEDYIMVDRTTTLRVRSFAQGVEPKIYTQTYVFLDDVLSQPAAPAGLPAIWQAADGNWAPADYQIDPEVVTDPRFVNSLAEDFLALPTFSIAMGPDDLFDPVAGIYANPLQRGDAWQRAASIEMIYPDDREGFQTDAGIRIQGGFSRHPAVSPKHSFRLKFTKQYGPSMLEFPLFHGETELFDNLILRAGSDDAWLSPDPYSRRSALLSRDRWVRQSQLDMGQPAARSQFVHLYLNGLYWGVYDLSERIDDAFGSTHFGGKKSHYDVIDSDGVADGDPAAWNALMAMAAAGVAGDGAYQQIQQLMDVSNFIDFMVLGVLAGKVDLAEGDWYAVRNRLRDEPFRFFCWDSEQTLLSPQEDLSQVTGPDGPAFLYAQLRQNAQFRRSFGDRVHRHMAGGGVLSGQANAARWALINDSLDEAIVAESARWGDYRRDVHPFRAGPFELYTRDDHFAPESQRVLEDYFTQRTETVIGQFRAAGLYPAVEAPTFSRHGGLIEPGQTVAITAPAGDVYYTVDGSDPWLLGAGVDPAASLYDGPIALDGNVVIKARTLLGGQFSAASEAVFYEPVPLQLSEVQYHALPDDDPASPYPGGDFDFIELTNIGHQPLDLTGLALTEGIWFDFSRSAVTGLDPGQAMVLVDSLKAFSTRYDTAGMLIAGEYSGRLSNSGERITLSGFLGQPVLDFTLDDDWYPITDNQGFALVPQRPGDTAVDLDDPLSWRPSFYPGGSPGKADPGYNPGSVVINEALTHSDGFPNDWIELYNTTDRDIDVGGWYLSDSKDVLKKYRIADGTLLPAHGYLVFTQDEHIDNPDAPGCIEPFGIASTGETIRLTSATPDGSLGGYREKVTFGYGFNPITFIRHTNSTGVAEWVPSSGNTPGTANSKPFAGIIDDHGRLYYSPLMSEVMYHPPAGGDEYIELYNPHDEPAHLFGPFEHEDTWRFIDGVYYSFPAKVTIPSHGYALVVGIDPDEFRIKYAVPPETQIFGPFDGELLNTGECLVLALPAPRGTFVPYPMADQVHYNGPGDWPPQADGLGASLNRRSFDNYGNEVLNWTAGVIGGTPGRPNVDLFPGSTVVGRHVFYNNSAFDAADPKPNPHDDRAIAPDKRALMPGQTATFANYTSFTGGLNGLMIDVVGSTSVAPDPGPDDFRFRIGNTDDPTTWQTAPPPSHLTVRPGDGIGGSTRVTITWPDAAIAGCWLQVTALSGPGTGLVDDDVFYFGNAIGESGNSATEAKVNVYDMLAARESTRNFLNPAPIDFPYDFDRDARVSARDLLISRNNRTHFLSALRLISPLEAAKQHATGVSPVSATDWLFEFQPEQERDRSDSREQKDATGPIDWDG